MTADPVANGPEMDGPDQIRLRDGRRLAITRTGWNSGPRDRSDVGPNGLPTVVFEAGMGAGRTSWSLVVPAVAAHTRTVTYDRAGFGGSTVDPAPRDAGRAAADLIDLVRQLDTGPVVLVTHSYGGLIVRQAATTSPELVAGLVLVDPTDEGCELFFSPAVERQSRWFARALPTLARLGVTRIVARGVGRALPEHERRQMVQESATVAASRAHAAELLGCERDLRRLRGDPGPAVDLPLTVISGTKAPRGRAMAERRDCLVAAHGRRVLAAPLGRHVRAERSEHLVMFTEPELVADEVLRVAEGTTSSR